MSVVNTFTVYIASGCDRGNTTHYRCFHKQEQLALHGIASTVRELYRQGDVRLDEALSHDLIILHRVAYSPFIEALIHRAHTQGKLVLFDTDDLVFEPEMTHWVDALRKMSEPEVALYNDGVRRYRQTMLACDAVLTATEFLAELVRRLGRPAFTHRNGLSNEQVSTAAGLCSRRRAEIKADRDPVIIGYFSGTPTHDRDFQEAAPALLDILTRCPDVGLHIAGPLELPPEFETLEDRIKRFPLLPLLKYPEMISQVDINLAPLEMGNPYCRAKSELKYIEAGVLGVPTVASRIDAFEYAIRHGENGLLAGDSNEWIAALEQLIHNAHLRREMGARAQADVHAHYTSQVRGRELVDILRTIRGEPTGVDVPIPLQQRETTEQEHRARVPLVINWVVSEPFRGSGGHTDIFRTIRYLSRFGHEQNVYVVPARDFAGMSDQEMAATIERDFFDIEADVYRWTGQVQEADVTFATHWLTAYLVNRLANGGLRCYFVQDFEPYFHPMGTLYLKAEHTYRLPFLFITLGKWLAQVCRSYGGEADYFDLAVDRDIFYLRPVGQRTGRSSIAFYARPSTPRRCFELGVEALHKVWERRHDVDILLFGADTLPYRLPFRHTNLGMLDQEALAQLFSGVDVGLVLSSTNCSLIPLEMMACKCAVVDLKGESVEAVLTHEENALLADPTPEDIAAAILRLLEDDELHQRIVERGYAHVQTLSWEKSARKVESILLQRIPQDQRLRARMPRQRKRQRTQTQKPERAQVSISDRQALGSALHQALRDLHGMRRRWDHRLFAALRHLARKLVGGWRVEVQGRRMKLLGELVGGRSVGQTFVAQQANLCRVDLLMATYFRTNTQEVIFHLREGPDAEEDLAVVRVNGSQIEHDRYHSFAFPSLPNSHQRSYYFYLESPGSIWGDAVSTWAFRGGKRIENGQPVEGQLVFAPFYGTGVGLEQGERPVPTSGWVVRWPPWVRTEIRTGLALLRQGKVSALIREVGRYLRRRGWV